MTVPDPNDPIRYNKPSEPTKGDRTSPESKETFPCGHPSNTEIIRGCYCAECGAIIPDKFFE